MAKAKAKSEYRIRDYPTDPLNEDVCKLVHAYATPVLEKLGDCCAAAVLFSFPVFTSMSTEGCPRPRLWYTIQAYVLPKVVRLSLVEQTAAILLIEKALSDRSQLVRNGYVCATLNEVQIAQGWDTILIDYFGFKRLDDDFMNVNNPNDTTRVCLLGRNYHKYAKVS